MTDEQKQKLKDYRIEYYKKYYAEKKLNNKNKKQSQKCVKNIITIIYKIFKMIYHIDNYKRVIKLSWSILLFNKMHQIVYFH